MARVRLIIVLLILSSCANNPMFPDVTIREDGVEASELKRVEIISNIVSKEADIVEHFDQSQKVLLLQGDTSNIKFCVPVILNEYISDDDYVFVLDNNLKFLEGYFDNTVNLKEYKWKLYENSQVSDRFEDLTKDLVLGSSADDKIFRFERSFSDKVYFFNQKTGERFFVYKHDLIGSATIGNNQLTLSFYGKTISRELSVDVPKLIGTKCDLLAKEFRFR